MQNQNPTDIVGLANLVWAIVALTLVTPIMSWIGKVFVGPCLDLRETIKDIDISLIRYANSSFDPAVGDTWNNIHAREGSDHFRLLSATVDHQRRKIFPYWIMKSIFRLPSSTNLNQIAKNLMGYSNSLGHTGSDRKQRLEFEEEIRRNLQT